MKQLILIGVMLLLWSGEVFAQTETPTVSTSPYVFATVAAGQMTRFDYVATAGSVHIANLLTLLFVSLWAMFLFAVFAMQKGKRA
jgi:hypothetical protein